MTSGSTQSTSSESGTAVRPAEPVSPQGTRFPAETIALESLVHHRTAVNAEASLEAVHRRFRDSSMDFFAVERDGRIIGLCARGQIGFMLGSRFGFALNSTRRVAEAMVREPLMVSCDTPVRALLHLAFSRHDESFHEDVVLLDGDGKLAGLIEVDTLVALQSRLVSEQMDELQKQHDAMRRQNLELFQTNHALRQSQGHYKALFDSHSLGIAMLDARGVVQSFNQRLSELVEQDGPTGPLPLLERLGERDRFEFLSMLSWHERAPLAGPQVRELMMTLPEKGHRQVRVTTGWIRETGQVWASFDDVTEQRSLERLMMKQEKQKLLDTLVGGIAHELNNKLTPVLGFAELLRFAPDERTKRAGNSIGRSVEEAAVIIRQLLQLSKPEAVSFQVIDLRSVIDESMLMLRFKVRDSGCAVRICTPEKPVTVLADLAQLKQVVINLVLNALHAMEGRNPAALRLDVFTRENQAGISVADTGSGIAPDIMGRIFDPFFTTKGPDRGTGLGLSICFSIMRQHGGDITVESEVGKGSTFTLTLPLERRAVQLSTRGEGAGTGGAQPIDLGSRARVLVVDDEEVVRSVLQEMLRSCFDCQIDFAQNGAEAYSLIKTVDYDLIVSDVRMPVMDGIELYLRLREERRTARERFVFVTGYAGDHHFDERIREWNAPVIAKPFRMSQLSSVCLPLLAARRS